MRIPRTGLRLAAGGYGPALLAGLLMAAPAARAQLADDHPQQELTAALTHIQPTAEELQQIQSKLAQLEAALAALRARAIDDDLVVDVEVNARAVQNLLRFPEEFFNHGAVDHALSALDDGLRRAGELAAGRPSWPGLKGRVARAFRSRVDGTAQPYRVLIPATYDPAKPIPPLVYLHGHGDTDLGLNWVGGSDRPEPSRGPGVNYLELQVFGRANSNYRWAAETDVLQAIESVERRYNIDQGRILLSGFSMGGAGTWQIGLHAPDLFCGLEVDAGVLGQRLSLDELTPAQRGATAPYGIMIPQAINVVSLPLVAYAGENDAQLASSTSIRTQLATEGFPGDRVGPFEWKTRDLTALYLVTPKQGHSHATGETLRLIKEFDAAAFTRGRVVPDHIRFVTYTTRYNRDFWVTIDGLHEQFQHSFVDATRNADRTRYRVATENISRLTLTDTAAANEVSIDGDKFNLERPESPLRLVRQRGHWVLAGDAKPPGLEKRHGLQGPVNDAFLDAFLCVRPTGVSPHPLVAARNAAELAKFTRVFAKQYRGDARTVPDTAVSDAEIAGHNLILFGDPESNAIIGRIVGQLPVTWTRDRLAVGGNSYDAADHVPVLIFPNPLNPDHYIVLNTGLPGPGSGSGPSYGDYAVLKVGPASGAAGADVVEEGGVFDEDWHLPTPP